MGPALAIEYLATVPRPRREPTVASRRTSRSDDQELSIKKATRNLEETLIRRALDQTCGNRTNAAKLLEISHRALLYKMKEYGIS